MAQRQEAKDAAETTTRNLTSDGLVDLCEYSFRVLGFNVHSLLFEMMFLFRREASCCTGAQYSLFRNFESRTTSVIKFSKI